MTRHLGTMVRSMTAAALVGLTACGSTPNQIDVSAYPPDMQARYEVFENRCTRCHELERPLNAHVGEGGWTAYVRRMSRHPAAGISDAEQRDIAIFLEYYHQRRIARPGDAGAGPPGPPAMIGGPK